MYQGVKLTSKPTNIKLADELKQQPKLKTPDDSYDFNM
jgi:hypothetical protein